MDRKSNKSSIIIIVAVASLTFAQYCDSAIIPCFTMIYETFDMSAFFQSFIVTGATIFSLPISLILGKVMGKIRKKPLLIGFLILYTVSGGLLGTANSTAMFITLRILSAMCVTPVMVVSISLVLQLYRDDERLNQVFGIYNGVGYIYSSVISAIAGMVCVVSWRNAQFLNLAGLIPLLLTIFFIPNIPADEDAAMEEQGDDSTGAAYDKKKLLLCMIEGFFGLALICVFMYFVDLYIAERAIGDSAMSGTISSACTLSSAVGAIALFGILQPKLKQYTGVAALLAAAAGCILLGFDIPIWAIYAISCVEGLGLGIMGCFYPAAVNECVPLAKMSMWQGIYNVASSLGFIMCSYVPLIFMSLFNCGYQKSIMASGVMLAVVSVITGLVRASGKEK